MSTQRTLAYILGGIAAGGAVYLGVTRMMRDEEAPRRRRRRGGDPGVVLVRVTENGKKYHRDDCPLLHGETRLIPVSYALESYEPCNACHPPADLDMSADELEELGVSGEASSGATSGAGS